MTSVFSTTSAPTNIAHARPSSRPGAPRRGLALLARLAAVGIAEGARLPAPAVRVRGGLPPGAIRRVRRYIETHLDEKVSIEALAGVAGLSIFHFARAFKQSQRVTPHEYVIQCRIRRAMELLARTDLALSRVAVEAGFSDQSHCARRFRERVGICPRDYRWLARRGWAR